MDQSYMNVWCAYLASKLLFLNYMVHTYIKASPFNIPPPFSFVHLNEFLQATNYVQWSQTIDFNRINHTYINVTKIDVYYKVPIH